MKTFDWGKFRFEKIAVHCKTEHDSSCFLELAKEYSPYLIDSYGNKDGYYYGSFDSRMYSQCYKTWKSSNYTILEWSDYVKFTKDDLKVGMLVCTERDMAIVMPYANGNVLVYKHGGHSVLDSFNFSNVIAVWGLANMPNITMCFSGSWRPLLYERKVTKEMTVEEISKALGYDVKVVKG